MKKWFVTTTKKKSEILLNIWRREEIHRFISIYRVSSHINFNIVGALLFLYFYILFFSLSLSLALSLL
jgi:hypothetical protein